MCGVVCYILCIFTYHRFLHYQFSCMVSGPIHALASKQSTLCYVAPGVGYHPLSGTGACLHFQVDRVFVQQHNILISTCILYTTKFSFLHVVFVPLLNGHAVLSYEWPEWLLCKCVTPRPRRAHSIEFTHGITRPQPPYIGVQQ